MPFQLVPGGFSYLERIQIGKNYRELETCRKSLKYWIGSNIFFQFLGGLSPEFQGILRPPRQLSSYGSPPTSYSATPVAAPPAPAPGGGDSYGSPVAPVVPAAPGGGDSYGSPVAPPVSAPAPGGGDSYGSPIAPVVPAAPVVPTYGSRYFIKGFWQQNC